MAKCSEPGCENEAIRGAKLCECHRDQKNKAKNSRIKAVFFSLAGVFVAVVGAVGFSVVNDRDRKKA